MYVCILLKSGNKLKSGKEMTFYPYLKGLLAPMRITAIKIQPTLKRNINFPEPNLPLLFPKISNKKQTQRSFTTSING